MAKETGNQVNYQAVGSGSGVRQYHAKTVDFGASDGAVSDEKQKLPMVHVPMTGGAIVPAYNYPGCDAKMTQTQLAMSSLVRSLIGLSLDVMIRISSLYGVLMVLVLPKVSPTLCLHSLLSGRRM